MGFPYGVVGEMSELERAFRDACGKLAESLKPAVRELIATFAAFQAAVSDFCRADEKRRRRAEVRRLRSEFIRKRGLRR